MKNHFYFKIEYYMKFAKPWDKNLGWGVWHSCFDYLYECESEYLVLSGVKN